MKKRKEMEKLLPIAYSGTILSDEINKRLKNYTEPVKSGVKKDEKIGFSKIKYTSALILGATCFKQKEVSELLGISYSTLRQWNMEENFKSTQNYILASIALELMTYFSQYKKGKKNKKIADAEIYNDGIFIVLIDLFLQKNRVSRKFKRQLPDVLIEAFGVKDFEKKRAIHVEKLILNAYLQLARKYDFFDEKILDYIDRYRDIA